MQSCKLSLLFRLLVWFFVSGVLRISFEGIKSTDDDEEEEEEEDSGLSSKWSSPNISVKELCSMGFMGLIWLNERDSSRVGLSGKGFSKMCCRLLQSMAESAIQCSESRSVFSRESHRKRERKKGLK